MAPQPDTQQTISGPSTSTAITTGPAPHIARHKVVLQWDKESKIKTCKCKICDERVKKFCHRCKSCGRRICSECSEEDGQSAPLFKEIARDYLQDGCWCGFRSNFNSAFRERIAQAQAARPVITPAPPSKSQKRKRKQSVETDAAIQPVEATERAQPTPDDTTIEHVPTVQLKSSTRPRRAAPAPSQPAEKSVGSSSHVSNTKPQDKVELRLSIDSTYEESVAKEPSVAQSEGISTMNSLQVEISQPLPTEDMPAPESGGDVATVELLDTAQSFKPIGPEAKRVKRAPRKPEIQRPEQFPTLTASKATRKQMREPEPQDIVIIGAGFIGMFTALELAKRAYANGKKQRITVIDINAAPCSLASGQCAGFLTVRGMPESWLPLVNAAAPVWGDLTDSEEFCNIVGFGQEVFTVSEIGEKRQRSTTWLHDSMSKDVVYDEDSLGTIDSPKLATWLQNQCEGYGIDFRFETYSTKVDKDRSGIATGVRIQHVGADATKAETLKCSHLVLAAGPFTKALFQQLFPSSALRLDNHVQSTQWMELSQANLAMERKTAIMVQDAAAEACVAFAVDPSKRTMKLSCTSRNLARVSDLRQRDALESRQDGSDLLSKLSIRYLDPQKVAIDDQSAIVAQGSAYVCTGSGGAPVIGSIRPQLLAPASGSIGGGVVWLCYGFGNFGTTVAPGVGRAVAEMLHGSMPTIDLSDFAVQEEHRVKAG